MGGSINRDTQKRWFTMENPIKMNDLGVSLFQETTMLFYYGFGLYSPQGPKKKSFDPSPPINKVSELFHEFNICAMLDLSCCHLHRTSQVNKKNGNAYRVYLISFFRIQKTQMTGLLSKPKWGDGKTAWEAIQQRVPYIGVCFTQEHVPWPWFTVSSNWLCPFISVESSINTQHP